MQIMVLVNAVGGAALCVQHLCTRVQASAVALLCCCAAGVANCIHPCATLVL